jgi:SAM-dependent methyltransferase
MLDPAEVDSAALLCPTCRTTIPWTAEREIICDGCAAAWPVEHGVPILRRNHDYYHELLPRDRMRALIGRTEEVGWQRALAEEIALAPISKRSALQSVFADEARAAFKAVLAPLDGKRVLDLGCGSGITSIGIARWAREVVSCDLTLERVAFLALRAREMHLGNVRAVCCGDARPLPFPDSSFDCVVLNGVLEWSAFEGELPVREGQLEFLGEVRRILRADGQLYVGIENRYGYGYFFGTPEDHTGVKYAAIVPRRLADVLVKRANGHPYRTYTYSYRAMRRLLEEAGFGHASFFAPIPDYRDFREIRALDRPAARTVSGNGGLRHRVKATLERSRWFTPSYGVVASAGPVNASWIDALVADLASRHSIHSDGRFPHVRVSATSTAGLIVTIGGAAVVRVPLDPANEARVRRNFEGLARAPAYSAALPGVATPHPLACDTLHGVFYTAESHVQGIPGHQLAEIDRVRADRIVFDLLIARRPHGDMVPQKPAPSRGELWRRTVTDPLRDLAPPTAGDETIAGCAALLKIAEACDPSSLPVAFTHGDLWSGNVLYDRRAESIALIDWDRWAEHDFATHDFLHFACYRRVVATGCSWPQAVIAWLHGEALDANEAQACERLVRALDLAPGWRALAALAYWAREVGGHPPAKRSLDPGWLARVVDPVVTSLIRQFGRGARERTDNRGQ